MTRATEERAATEDRDNESRAAEMREPKINLGSRDRFHIDPDIVPPGMRYQWVCYLVRNQPNRDNIAQAQREGWRFVPPDRHPDHFPMFAFPGEEKPTVVEIGGLALMERPEHICQQFEARNQRATQDLTDAMYHQIGLSTGPAPAPGYQSEGQIRRQVETREGVPIQTGPAAAAERDGAAGRARQAGRAISAPLSGKPFPGDEG